MTKENLLEALENGVISQEEYIAKVKMANDTESEATTTEEQTQDTVFDIEVAEDEYIDLKLRDKKTGEIITFNVKVTGKKSLLLNAMKENGINVANLNNVNTVLKGFSQEKQGLIVISLLQAIFSGDDEKILEVLLDGNNTSVSLKIIEYVMKKLK